MTDHTFCVLCRSMGHDKSVHSSEQPKPSPRSERRQRKTTISVRLTHEERQRLVNSANAEGITLGAYVRRTLGAKP